MIRYIFLFLSFSIISFSAHSQRMVNEESTFMQRLYLGGNFGFQLGTNFTQIEVSPAVGYMINNKASAGVGVIYQYFKTKFRDGNGNIYSFDTNIYGGKFFGRYNVTDFIFAYSEFENINLDVVNLNSGEIERGWVPGLFVGAGYFQPLGRRAGINLMLLYNLLYDPFKSPYNSAFNLRVGFSI